MLYSREHQPEADLNYIPAMYFVPVHPQVVGFVPVTYKTSGADRARSLFMNVSSMYPSESQVAAVIDNAIVAERERCARIAEDAAKYPHHKLIADAIRSAK